jgi:arabinofuranan 3-O-arabinosyltransferase
VLSTVGGLSAEAHPALLVPLVLLPLVLADRGRLGPRRAAALSALAVLACGGVNATATALAAVPAALWILTRPRWWRSRLTAWWAGLSLAAVAWWLGPLVILGRWSPPFLDWIERAADVLREIDVLDVARGTTHWLGFVVTSGGEWWPAGYQLATSPLLVLATGLLAAAALAGLALPGLPERRFLLATLAVGLVLLVLPLGGPLSSPLAEPARALLDGPLVALRNIHKADPLVRLPLAVGLAFGLSRVGAVLAQRRAAVRVGTGLAVLAVVVTAISPGFSGAIAPRGTFTDMAAQWRSAGAWLSQHSADGRALVVPASSFGEYQWGRTIDEPLRPLSTVDYAVRDAVPLTPAGTIRFLDAVEQRLQTGRSLGGAVDVLRRTGIRYLVLRNDLDTAAAGQPSVTYARSAVRGTEGVTFAQGFGTTRIDLSGERVQPVEVYDLGPAAPLLVTQPVDDVVGVRGGSEDLPAVADAGVEGLTVLEGDAVDGVVPGRSVLTDGYRARERWFGATRGQDVSSTLARGTLEGSRDYRPWADLDLHSVVTVDGVAGVTASSSLADEQSLAGLRPALRPAAALDGDPSTAWIALLDDSPSLRLSFDGARSLGTVRVTVAANRARWGGGLGVPTRLRLVTDAGERTVEVPSSGVVEAAAPAGATRSLVVRVLDTDRGAPSGVLTGLAEVAVDGVTTREVVDSPAGAAVPVDAVVLDRGVPGTDGCVRPEDEVVCFGDQVRDPEGGVDLVRRLSGPGGGELAASGTMTVSPWVEDLPGLAAQGIDVTASSSRTRAPAGRPEAVVDGDDATAWSPSADDRTPTLTLRLDAPADVGGIRLEGRRDWFARYRPVVGVTLDGREQVVRATEDGFLAVRGTRVRTIELAFLPEAGRPRAATASLELSGLDIPGVELPQPTERLDRPCGQGPALTVDGASVPTRLMGPRSALWGDGTLRWTACSSVRLTAGDDHEVEVQGDGALRPDTVALVGAEATRTPTTTAIDARRVSPTRVTATLDSGPQRILALAGNHNDGWAATLDGSALRPIVVDGFRQGFVVPAGSSGALDVTFTPDRPYRWALLVGVVLALLLPVAALVRDPAPGRREAVEDTHSRGLGLVGTTVLGAALVLGPWAGLVAAAVAAALVLRRQRGRLGACWPALAAGSCVVAATGLAALTEPARPTRPSVEVVAAVLLTVALVCAVVGPSVPPRAWRAARRRRGSATPGRG